MYENRRENKDKKEQVSVGEEEGKHFNRYDVCLGRRTPDDRRFWCGLTFNSNYILKKRCNVLVYSKTIVELLWSLLQEKCSFYSKTRSLPL